MNNVNLLGLEFLLFLVSIIANVVLAISVFFYATGQRSRNLFLFFVTAQVLWASCNYLTFIFKDPFFFLWASRFTLFFAVFHTFSFFLFVYYFSQDVHAQFWKKHAIVLFAFTIIVATLTLSSLTFLNVVFNVDGQLTPQVGPAMIVFGIFDATYLLSGLFILIRHYLRSAGEKKQQTKYLLIGFLFTIFFILIFILFNFVIFGNFTLVRFGHIYTLPFIAFAAYAIVKHHFFNFKIIAAKVLTVVLWIVLFSRIFVYQTINEVVINSLIFATVFVFGVLLIRSVQKEVAQRERIERLMTELNKSNDKLWVANEKLQELDKLKTEFVSLATHQLRSPLTAIKGYASMVLENSFGEVGEKVRGAVDVIFQSSQKLVKVIEDFLSITRIELGTMKYDQSEFDFRALVENVSKELKVTVEKKGLQFSFEADPAGDYKLIGDSGKLAQVIGNLIDNAIKYTPKGGIKVMLNKAEGKIRLEISDSGVGMVAEVIPKLFQKFTRADDAGKVNIAGTGLGLYVAKQIVEAHHGKIWAESDGVGKGSRFIVELETK